MFIDLNCFLRWVMWPMGLLFTQYFERFVSKIPVNLYWLCGNRVQVEITGDLSCSLLPLLLDTVLFLSFLHQQTICPVLNSARKFFSCTWKILFDTWFCLMIALLFFFRQKNCLLVIYRSIWGKRPGQKVNLLPRNILLAR